MWTNILSSYHISGFGFRYGFNWIQCFGLIYPILNNVYAIGGYKSMDHNLLWFTCYNLNSLHLGYNFVDPEEENSCPKQKL